MLQFFGKSRYLANVIRLNSNKLFSTTCFVQKAKFFDNAEEALSDVKDGATILSGGFFVCGLPENCYTALKKLGPKNLTIASISSGIQSNGIEQAIAAKQVKKLITTYIGENAECVKQYLKGELEVEFSPMGSLVERIQAGGAGIPAFYTATGVGTLVQTGGIPVRFKPNGDVDVYSKPKEVRDFNGRKFILEEAVTGDFALVKAWKSDRNGNLVFRKSARNINPEMAKAAKVVIAEVEEIVETGSLDPDQIHIPHIYVDRVFKGKEFHKKFRFEKLLSTTTQQKQKSKGDLKRERIARRAVFELKDGMTGNLGVGIPTMVASMIKPGVNVTFQAEVGILGVGPYPKNKQELDFDLVNAGAESTTVVKGASFLSTGETFAMIRGGHIDWTILGALQVSKDGDLANWMGPGKNFRGIGGAMDLVATSGTKVMITMEHTEKNGAPKLMEDCTLPLTGKSVVDMIVTEMGVFMVDRVNGGLTLTEIASDVTVDQVKAATGCEFKVADDLKPMAQA